ncbi:CobW family GTP-binding protein [Planktotalea arctica]|uniref:CobW family GTP-binding protein n=1 Tax=Planktotalea arctica TaxID=1481893 RepID=UPI000A1754A0|nr:CobW family GTP-binding protein [Planktotalea arctica]
MSEPLLVTIIGGYLGAGKTTMVNHLLRTANGRKLAIMVNEFGALPIDADLIEAQGDDLISIAGGCVCCSFGSDLSAALIELGSLPVRPDQVVIECSGVAIPSAIAASVTLLDGFTPDGTVVLVDAETIRESAENEYIGDTITRQLADADLVVMNKADLVSAMELTALEAWLQEIAPRAKTLSAEHGKAPLDLVLGLGSAPILSQQSGHADGLFDSIALPCPRALEGAALAAKLTDPALNITRAKGFFDPAPSGTRKALHIVGRRWEITEAPQNAPLGIVCIGLKGQFDGDLIRESASETL